MKILIAGGTGFIGLALTRKLVESGHTVSILSRTPFQHQERGVNVLLWDGRSVGQWKSELTRCDAIVNLAGASIGSSRWSAAFKAKILTSRLNSTRALLDAAAETEDRPRILVNASAVGFYGHGSDDEVTESSPAGNDFLAETCVQWEQAAMRGEELGMRVALTRTGFVIGKSAPAFRKMVMPYRFYAGGIYGDGRQWFPWVHVDDVASAYIFALENEAMRGPVNVVSPGSQTSAEFAKGLGEELGRPAWMRVPAWGLRLVLGEMSDLLLKGQRAVPRRLLENGFSFRFPTTREALRDVLA